MFWSLMITTVGWSTSWLFLLLLIVIVVLLRVIVVALLFYMFMLLSKLVVLFVVVTVPWRTTLDILDTYFGLITIIAQSASVYDFIMPWTTADCDTVKRCNFDKICWSNWWVGRVGVVVREHAGIGHAPDPCGRIGPLRVPCVARKIICCMCFRNPHGQVFIKAEPNSICRISWSLFHVFRSAFTLNAGIDYPITATDTSLMLSGAMLWNSSSW